MAGELQAVVRELTNALDRLDFEAALATAARDIQGIDEISRRWMRGRDDVANYMRQLEGAISDVRSELRDVREVTAGDFGIVTCWLEQDYTLQGQRQHVSAPTTVVLRREGGAWRIALFHSTPLPEGGA